MGATPLDDLREELLAGQAVVIVGAGVSIAATGGVSTASWVGLLNDGVAYCGSLFGPSLPTSWVDRRRAQIASGDLDELVGAAEDLTRRLGGPAGGEFRRWLAHSIGKLSPASPAVLKALAGLGVPLATTNYDGLLEVATGRPAVTWRQSALFEQVLRGDHQAILHLHGYWQDSESVVLGVRSYQAVVGDAHADAMRRALASTRTLVFVGCGAGLEDPNFGALRQWLAEVFASSPYRHYRLCLQQELAELWREHGLAERIVPVAYGEDHDDLAPFLQNLVSGARTGRSASPAISAVALSPTSAPPRIWNVPYPRNRIFTGREDLLEELAAGLREGTATAITQAIAGLGGVGKTSLAVEYAYWQQAAFDVVWWLRAEEPATLVGDFTALAGALGLPEHNQTDPAVIAAALHRWLAGHDRWLLVFDNAERADDLDGLLPRGGGGQVLVTSRNPVWRRLATPLRVDVLAPAEAEAFLLRRSSDTDQTAAAELAEELGGLPLALEQAAAYCEQVSLGLADYLDRYRRAHARLLDMGGPADYPATVTTTWRLNVDQVAATSPAAVQLLSVAAFLAPEAIPPNVLGADLGVLPADLAQAAEDELVLDAAVGALYRYSLISRDQKGIRVHRLVQAVVRSDLADQESKWATLAVRLVLVAFPARSDEVTTWPICERLLAHALTVAGHAERLKVASEQTGDLLDRASVYLRARGQPRQARPLAERALTLTEQALGPDHPTTGIRYDELGRALREAGYYQAAREHLERALAIHEAVYGSNDRSVGHQRNELGMVLLDLGDLAGARTQFERALEIGQATLGPDHPEMATLHGNLGIVFGDLGDLVGAREQYERALEIGQATLGPDHYKLGAWHNNLGGVLQKLGDLAGARIEHEQALAIGQTTLGPNHPTISGWHGNIGNMLRELGDLAGARTQYQRALEIGQATLGPDHPEMATLHGNFGVVLYDLGDLVGARAQYERALEIGHATLGPDHLKMAIWHNNLGRVLRSYGDLAGARTQFEKALEIGQATLGPNHPDQVIRHGNLANVLADLGDLVGARSELLGALEIGQTALRPDDPEMATLQKNLERLEYFLEKSNRDSSR